MSVLLPATGAGTPDVTVASDSFGGEEHPVTVVAGANFENSGNPKRLRTDDDGYVYTQTILQAGAQNIGDVDVLTVPADPFGANADAAATAGGTGSMQAKFRLMTSLLDAIKTAVEILDNQSAVGLGLVSSSVARVVGAFPANTYFAYIPHQVHVAAASTIHWDLFNADASKIVRVVSIKQLPDIVTAVTGVATAWLLERTTSVGTGGSSITPWLGDTVADAALDADVTCRSKPSGGAAQSTDLFSFQMSSEETNAATIMVATLGGLELVPEPLRAISAGGNGKGIVLNPSQGICVRQNTNSSQGNTGWLIAFTVDP